LTDRRLIEVAFPLKQTSLDSVHEKNVRHGHISTLHIWPARRPLAACRAALIATLLPDPGDPDERREILKRLAGTVGQSYTVSGNRAWATAALPRVASRHFWDRFEARCPRPSSFSFGMWKSYAPATGSSVPSR